MKLFYAVFASLLLAAILEGVTGDPQFANLRIFPGNSFKTKKSAPEEEFRRNESPVKRISMSSLLKQLQRPSSANTESKVRKVLMSAGPVVLSKKPNFSTFPKNSPIVMITEPTTTSTTTTTTTTTTPPPTTSRRKLTPPTKSVRIIEHLRKEPTSSLKISSEGLKVSKTDLGKLPNSPIYYIRLPPSPYSFVPGLGYVSQTERPPAFPFLHVPVDFSSNGKPSNVYVVNKDASTTTTTTTEKPATTTPAAPVTRTTEASSSKPTATTNSRIIYLKGPFVFGGKPSNVYTVPAPYRPQSYFEVLSNLYPKLKRAQFIR